MFGIYFGQIFFASVWSVMTTIYISPTNDFSIMLDNGNIIMLPFETTDSTIQANIAASTAYAKGLIVLNNSYEPDFTDITNFNQLII